ncbi:protease FtsH subunit HflK [Tranquillimonas rosea]|uniref:Protein HflK n=1 Tax=Tranquillimonas rosea TaxID=641238 RepID=A0A1H9WE29_9RHOB|nr:FtsH protease activity modulator HflK [Tranquillimonas rosea]SES32049.1 protease FtsH subunit HflK [Tranquillimonas rosea]
MASNKGGPWGGGPRGTNGSGGSGSGGGDDRRPGGQRPGEGRPIPEIDEIMKKGQEHLRVLMGGRGGRSNGPSGGSGGPSANRATVVIAIVVLAGLWVFNSLYTVQPEEQGVELFLGDFRRTTDDGLHFAPWPLVTAEVIPVTTERTEDIGMRSRDSRSDGGLMLTTDENIVDIDFQVVWNVSDPSLFLFNLRDPQETVRAVSEAAMREIIAQSQLAPILNVSREEIAAGAEERIQSTLNSYDSGINIVRVNLNGAEPPEEVIDAFREVQAAEQERERLTRQADAYANRVLAGARGEAAQTLEEAEGYRARVVNEAQGEASRFTSVLSEYSNAPEVTRKRLYLETMEQVLGDVDKIILDEQIGGGGSGGGQGVVPYLPLNELRGTTGSGQAQQSNSSSGSSN